MQLRRRSVLVPVMAGIGGLVVGATFALLTLRGVTAEWVAATGTWVGAVGTVVALLWAVRTFRADQADREEARDVALTEQLRQEAERVRQEAERKESIRAAAALVTIGVRPVQATGDRPDLMLDLVTVTLTNDSTAPVRVSSVTLGRPLRASSTLPSDTYLEGSMTKSFQVYVEPTPITPEELGHGSAPRFGAEMTYVLGGREWTTSTAEGASPQLTAG
jgi:hypothetical protein